MIHARQALTAPEEAMVLASLSDSCVCHLLREKSLTSEVSWLETALHYYAFEFDPESWDFERPVSEFPIPRFVEAALGFVSQNKIESQGFDPVLGELEMKVLERRFHFHPAVVPPFLEMVRRHLRDRVLAIESLHERIGGKNGADDLRRYADYLDEIKQMTTHLAFAAVAADRPDVLRLLLAADPDAATRPCRNNLLDDSETGLNLSPYGLVFAASRSACADVMHEFISEVDPSTGVDVANPQEPGAPLTLLDLCGDLRPAGVPSVVAQGLKHRLSKEDPVRGNRGMLYAAATQAMNDDESLGFGRYVPAFTHARVYDLDATHSFEYAIKHGQPYVVKQLADRADWTSLPFADEAKSPVMVNLIDAQMNQREPAYQQALVELISAAARTGNLPLVFHQFVKPNQESMAGSGVDSIEPLGRILGLGFTDVLRKWLEHGLDPTVPVQLGFATPLDVARTFGEEGAQIMRSFVAHKKVTTLLESAQKPLDAVHP